MKKPHFIDRANIFHRKIRLSRILAHHPLLDSFRDVVTALKGDYVLDAKELGADSLAMLFRLHPVFVVETSPSMLEAAGWKPLLPNGITATHKME